MKLYRDLTEGEALRAGDEYRLRSSETAWTVHTAEDVELFPDATVGFIDADDIEWRRPVDAVPREETEYKIATALGMQWKLVPIEEEQ